MKKIISFFLTLAILFNMELFNSSATDALSSKSFFGQIHSLAYEYDMSNDLADSEVFISSTNRLIVKTKTNEPLHNTYSAVAVVEGYDCLHILQYLNSDQAKYAAEKLSLSEETEFVESDFYFKILDETASYAKNVSKSTSWNTVTAKVKEATNYLNIQKMKCFETRVAVVDTGVYAAHSHFDNINKKRIVDSQHTYDIPIMNGNKVEDIIKYSSMEDGVYHGTMAAGVVFDNSMDNIKIVPYRVTNNSTVLYTDLLMAFDRILKGNIDVVNISLAPYVDDSDSCLAMQQYIKRAIEKGVVVVAASGNIKLSGEDDTAKFFPACMPEVITVAASDENNMPAYRFSTHGTPVDIAAPGTNLTCPSPRLKSELENGPAPAENDYITSDGTSFAAPLVAAAAAMLKSIYPDISPALVEEIIKESAYVPDNWAESCGEKNYGVGIIDFYNMLMVAKEKMKPQIFFNSANKFEIKSLEPSHTIYYTLDGSEPTPENGVLYTEPLDLSKKVINVIKAASFMGDAQVGETTVYRMTSFKDMKINRGETEKAVSDSYSGKIRWRSDNLAVATVDSEGNVTGVSEGKTNVVATLESGKRIIFNVTVKEQPLYWLIELFEFWLSLFGINI